MIMRSCSLFLVSLSPSDTLSLKKCLTFFVNVPYPKSNFSPSLPIISLFHALSFNCPGDGSGSREKTWKRRERERERERKESGAEEGGMHFTDVPPHCTHSSRAVHPVLSSPPPPKLTQHAARTHTSHTLKHTQTHTSSTSHNAAHSSSSMLPIGQHMTTLSFFYSFLLFVHYCFPLHAASCTTATTTVFSLITRAVFHFTWTRGNKMFLIS